MDTIKPPRISAKTWQTKVEQLTRENESIIYQLRKKDEQIADMYAVIRKLESEKK